MSRNLLIVEDDIDQLDLLTWMFVGRGYAVSAHDHPRMGLKAAVLGQFEVVLVDDTLPHVDIVAYVRRMRRILPEVHVIVLASSDDPEWWTRLRSEGAFAPVQKPWHWPTLEDVVEQAFTAAPANLDGAAIGEPVSQSPSRLFFVQKP